MARYVAQQAQNGFWMVVEEGSTNPVAGEEGFRTGMGEEEAKKLAAHMNAEASEGRDERTHVDQPRT